MYVRTCIHVSIDICTYIQIHTYAMHIYTHIFVYSCVYVIGHTCVCMYICTDPDETVTMRYTCVTLPYTLCEKRHSHKRLNLCA